MIHHRGVNREGPGDPGDTGGRGGGLREPVGGGGEAVGRWGGSGGVFRSGILWLRSAGAVSADCQESTQAFSCGYPQMVSALFRSTG